MIVNKARDEIFSKLVNLYDLKKFILIIYATSIWNIIVIIYTINI